MADDAGGRASLARQSLWLAVTVVVQLVVLYLPRGVAPPPSLPGADKVVHAAAFFVPVLFALRLLPRRAIAVVAVFAGHAVLSEVLQASVLPARSGDAWDVAADLLGVLLGWSAWLAVGCGGRHASWMGRR